MIANFISDFWYEQSRDLIASVTNRFGNRAISSFTYGNDAAGRRISIRKGGEAMGPLAGSVVTCAYDHMGRNVMKDGVMFIWDDYNIIVENLGASNETHNIWGLDLDGTMQGAGGVGGLLAVERNGSVAFPAYDANGNITEYVSGGGDILSHSEYSSFGRELVHSGSDDFTHRFSTKPYCRKTGVLEFQLRRYRPRCGRWMNRDAIEEDGGLNLYGFVWNASIYKFDNKGNLPLNLILIVQLRNCLGTIMAWKPGGKNDSDANDKNKHCRASCDIANDCGAAASALLGLGKEIGDNFGLAIESIVNMIPNELMSEDSKNWVRNHFMSSSIRDSIGDLIADANGIACAISGKSCDECCENECPK